MSITLRILTVWFLYYSQIASYKHPGLSIFVTRDRLNTIISNKLWNIIEYVQWAFFAVTKWCILQYLFSERSMKIEAERLIHQFTQNVFWMFSEYEKNMSFTHWYSMNIHLESIMNNKRSLNLLYIQWTIPE